MSTDEMEEIARRGPLAIVKYHGEFWVTGPEIMVIVEDEKEGREFIDLLYEEFGPKK
jgi:hypothetical protein